MYNPDDKLPATKQYYQWILECLQKGVDVFNFSCLQNEDIKTVTLGVGKLQTIKYKIKMHSIMYNQDGLLFILSVYNNQDVYTGCKLVTINLLPYLNSKNIKDELKRELHELIKEQLEIKSSEYSINNKEYIFNRLEEIISYWQKNTLKIQQYISTELAHTIIDSEEK